MRQLFAAALIVAAGLAFAQPTGRTPASAAADCPVCPELALVPPGRFLMGSAPDAVELDASTGESPAVAISFTRPFHVSRREITVGEFRRYVDATGAQPAPGCRVWLGGQWVHDQNRSWRDPGSALPPQDTEPVVCVNWDDGRAYAEWLSELSGKRYRLPSEAEWEYVARGGTSFPRFWGEHDSSEHAVLSLACDFANVYDTAAVDTYDFPWPNARCSDRVAGLAPVGQYKPNAFGTFDIIGNVREWVMDCYTASYAGRPEDGRAWIWQGGCGQRGVRGGSWASRPRDARAPARDSEPTGHRQSDLGFRVVRDYD